MASQPVRCFTIARIFLAASIFAPSFTYAQNENDIVDFLNAGKSDGEKLMQAYLNPMIEGVSYSFNGGWYHTAKAHKSLGFDLGVSVNAVFIPSSKNYFNPGDLNLQVAQLSTPASGKAPTIIGPKDPTRYSMDWDNNNIPDGPTAEFGGPEGLDFKKNFKVRGVVAPTAQLGIGIYKNTDLKIRWMPEVDAGSSKVKLFGLGVLHDVKQHIPGIKHLPFDLSMLVAFTNIKGSTDLTGGSIDGGSAAQPQLLNYTMNAWIFQALISKKVSVITFYGGIGYNTIKTTADLTGTYVIPSSFAGSETLKNPFALGYKNKSLKVTAGIRLKLGPIYLNGDYSLQEYSTLSVGLGVAVR